MPSAPATGRAANGFILRRVPGTCAYCWLTPASASARRQTGCLKPDSRKNGLRKLARRTVDALRNSKASIISKLPAMVRPDRTVR
jgi:hypothetical protein